MGLGRYLKRVLISLDQLGNVLIGGREDETISSRAGRYDRSQPKSGAPSFGDVLDAVEKDHSENAIEFTDYGRPQAHGLDDRPKGAAKYQPHAFMADEEGHCLALVDGVTCKAPLWHECHDMPPELR